MPNGTGWNLPEQFSLWKTKVAEGSIMGLTTGVEPLMQFAEVDSVVSTSSTSFVTLGFPLITATNYGSPGTCASLVYISTVIGIDGGTSQASGWQGIIGLSVDGSSPFAAVLFSMGILPGTTTVPAAQSTCTRQVVIGVDTSAPLLSPGSHTYQLYFQSVNGQSIHFSATSIVVQPL